MSQHTTSTMDEFRQIREDANKRLIAHGLASARVPAVSSLESSSLTREDIERLKLDLAYLIELEGKRSFWSGILVNSVFFVLGLVTSTAISIMTATN